MPTEFSANGSGQTAPKDTSPVNKLGINEAVARLTQIREEDPERLAGLLREDHTIDVISVEEPLIVAVGDQEINLMREYDERQVPWRLTVDMVKKELQYRFYPHDTLAESVGRTGIILNFTDHIFATISNVIEEQVGRRVNAILNSVQSGEKPSTTR